MTNAERPVIVTGGASGIGAAIVSRLEKRGYPVANFDLNAPEPVDITNYEAVEQSINAFAETHGPLYGLVNNAGWDFAQPFAETHPEQWRRVVDINLYGPLNVTHLALQSMLAAGTGRVVSIASDAGRVGSSGEAVYSACKGGIIALMKTLARENARAGLTFNTICPGPTNTPLLESFDAKGGLRAALERAIPMRRLAEPDDFPGLVEFFLSDDAAFITGQTISVSGGLSMHG